MNLQEQAQKLLVDAMAQQRAVDDDIHAWTGVSANTASRIRKAENVSLDTLDRLFRPLGFRPVLTLEALPDDTIGALADVMVPKRKR